MTPSRIRPWLLSALFCLLVAAPLRGEGGADRTLSPYFFVQDRGGSSEAFPLQSTDVTVHVNGVIADIVVRQTYVNEGVAPINARYVFPGSTRASVHGMTITIGAQRVVARIRERERAEEEFEAARAEGKSASLLRQQRPNVFTMNVANILPHDRVEVELHYTELLVPTGGTYEFVYPTVVGPRYSNQPEATVGETDRFVQSPYRGETGTPGPTFDIRVTLSTGLPLREVRCTSHPVAVAWGGRALAEITLEDPAGRAGNRDFILEYRLAGREIETGLLLHEGEEENFFLLMVQPPERVAAAGIPPREYIFVLDVSGSMNGFPLATARSVIGDLIGHLREEDLFNVVLFAGGSLVLAPSSLAATEENVQLAFRGIEQVRGGGSTEIVTALRTALALPRDEGYSRTVVVITDGFISAERRVFEVIRGNLHGTNFFCFGIGSGVNRYLVEGMARAGLGEPFVVTKPEEAAAAALRFRKYIESPVLTNLQVRFNGFGAYEVEPPVLPDLFARRPIVLFGKWRGRREGEIEVLGMTAGGPFLRTLRVGDSRPLEENGALRYLWARERIARLSDFNFGEVDADVAGRITSLGLTYSLLTRYTSFIAVLETIRNPAGGAREVDQPLPLPQGVSHLAVGVGYGRGPEPELWILAAIAGALVAYLTLLRRRRFAPAARRGETGPAS